MMQETPVKRHNSERSVLPFANHARATIYSLPDELLQAIFELHKAAVFAEIEPFWRAGNYIWRTPNPQLLLPTAVCTRWQAVARATPSLWQDVFIGTATGWALRVCLPNLARKTEARMPLRLYITGANAGDKWNALTVIGPVLREHFADRIAHITLYDASHPSLVNLDICLVRHTLTALRSVEIFGTSSLLPHLDHFFSDIPQGLQELTIRNVHPNWKSPVFGPQLRKLSIEGPTEYSAPQDPISFDEFLGVLQRCVNLEVVQITFARFPFDSRGADDPLRAFSDKMVSLPKLQTLSLRLTIPGVVYALLSHVSLPITADISIVISTGERTSMDGLMDTIPADRTCLPILSAATHTYWYDMGFECARKDDDGTTRGRLMVDFPPDSEDWLGDSAWAHQEMWLDVSAALLADAPLRHLGLGVYGETGRSYAEYEALFRAFPDLVELVVDGMEDPTELLDALEYADNGHMVQSLRTLNLTAANYEETRMKRLLKRRPFCTIRTMEDAPAPNPLVKLSTNGLPFTIGTSLDPFLA